MIALLQRVSMADVSVEGKTIGAIGHGLMILVCAVKGDDEAKARSLASRVLRYRIFEDEAGKMNRSVTDVGGEILVVSQFTLAADTHSGNRPSFSPAADPQTGRVLYELFARECAAGGLKVQTGEFGAHMAVRLVNDGPVTIWLKA